MAAAIEFVLNGRPVRVENISPNTTLLNHLRSIGLTGAKEGCAEGDCGACTVAVLDRDAHGKACYRAINSCLVPLPAMAGRDVVTVEGVAGDELHPVQQEMVDHNGSQCGYCTPGIICSLFEGYYRDDLLEDWQLEDQLCGNLCRCTGYHPIRCAAKLVIPRDKTGESKDPFVARLKPTPTRLGAANCSGAGKSFHRPASLAALLRLMQERPGAQLVAGATEVGVEITKKFRTFPALISLEAVPELTEIKSTESDWHVGATATLTAVEELLSAEFPALAKMLRVFGSRQIRNRATLGGNLVTASPIGDAAPVLLAFEAKVALVSERGERVLSLDEFFVAYRKTALQPGEVMKSVILPRPVPRPGVRRLRQFYKVSKRREMDISTVAACFAVELNEAGVVQKARLAYGGVAPMPVRARETERVLLGKPWNAGTLAEVLPVLRGEFNPISDVRGSESYRRQLITSLFEKFFGEQDDHSNPQDSSLHDTLSWDWEYWPNRATPHESAHTHVTGEAIYTDDQMAGRALLEVWPVCAPHAHARLVRRDATVARAMPGVRAVLLAEDIPGLNDVGVVRRDEPLLADREVFFHGQLVALVVGDSLEACRLAAEKVVVECAPLPPILTIEQAIAADSFHNEPNFIRRGDAAQALVDAPRRIEGEFCFGGQEHFYLETQAAWAERGEDGTMQVVSSTQHPSEVQSVVAHVLHLPANKVVVQSPRMGGGFGGKETQAATPAALAALAAQQTGRPVRVRWNRDQDMMLTGKRHPFRATYQVGFDQDGLLHAAKIQLVSNGGWSLDLSQAVTDRALFHLDNAYYIPQLEFQGRVARTHLVSNTAFRGFGGPQGMLVIEEILDRIARRCGLPPEAVRERNLYRGRGGTNTTPYGQEIEDNRIQTIWHELKGSSRFEERRRELAAWNREHTGRKRGLAMTPVKFGISFTVTHLNQAGALVLIYRDGSVQVNHGGTEMGQGIHTNIQAIAARELGLPLEAIRVMATSTDKVPNTSATAASAGTDLNGAAVRNACEILRARLIAIAQKLCKEKSGREFPADALTFKDGFAEVGDLSLSFAEVVARAYLERVSLSATGFYATPGIHWDRSAGRGRPFHYFANGAAVTEVEVDGFTGMTRVLRTDILQDVGDSINEGVNRGQVEGGFVQGMGWLTAEELKWDEQGRLLTHSPDTYKIPAFGDAPIEFNVRFLPRATQSDVIHGSKAVGEPPLMLAISVREAIRDAVAAFGPPGDEVSLASPATCEAVFAAITKRDPPGTGA